MLVDRCFCTVKRVFDHVLRKDMSMERWVVYWIGGSMVVGNYFLDMVAAFSWRRVVTPNSTLMRANPGIRLLGFGGQDF